MAGRRNIPQDPDPFGDEVTLAWAMTTTAQREKVVEDWDHGQKRYHEQVSLLLHLNPDALRLASFLEFGHPSVCKENGRPRHIHYGKLCEMMKRYPVDNSPKSVDKSPVSVDKSVSNPVEKNATYPQDTAVSMVPPHDSPKLSTYPHFIHNPPVDKIY